jgi:hypothetical protein
MSTATVNGITAAVCSLMITASGIPFADVELTDTVTLPPRSILIIGSLTMVCTATRQGTYLGRTQARLVAGAAGWRNPVTARGYGSPAGVQLAQVIADAATEVGETVGVIAPVPAGPFYTRRAARASQVFDLVPAGLSWWVDLNGLAQVGTRTPSIAVANIQVIDWDTGIGRAIVAAEENAGLIPGATILNPDIGSVTINSARWYIQGGSQLRGELWTQAA